MTELPGYLAAAWGKQGKPTRGPKPALSLEKVVAAGVAVADAEGLAGVSMSRVAAEVGAKPMSLYRYVDSKDALLALMIDHAGGPPPVISDGDWRAGLTQWSYAYLGLLQAHPWILRIPINGPPATPNQLRWMEAGLQQATGFDLGDRMGLLLLLSGYVRSWATLNADIEAANADPEAMMVDYGSALSQLVTEAEFPVLSQVIAAGIFTYDPDEPPDADFVFGLDRILDGMAVIRNQDPPKSPVHDSRAKSAADATTEHPDNNPEGTAEEPEPKPAPGSASNQPDPVSHQTRLRDGP